MNSTNQQESWENPLGEEQEGLQKQKIEGFTEYSNDMNSLTSKQFAKFLITSSTVKPFMKDFKNFVSNGVKPYNAVKEVFDFFSKEEDLVLDVFSGTGENLKILSDLSRLSTGIERDKAKIKKYEDSIMEDTFLDSSLILQGDALEVSKTLTAKYDLIVVDPPVKTSKFCDESQDIESRTIEGYVSYLAELIDSLANSLADGKFLVCFMQDFYHKGSYHMLPARVGLSVSSLRLRGIKIYSRQLDINNIPNKKVYAPVQNHFHVLIFSK